MPLTEIQEWEELDRDVNPYYDEMFGSGKVTPMSSGIGCGCLIATLFCVLVTILPLIF